MSIISDIISKLSRLFKRAFNNRKKRFWLDCIFGTMFIFLLIGLVVQVFSRLNFLDPVGDALEDIEVTDLVFSRLRGEPAVDQHITIVNIARLDRRGIAEQLRIINKYGPKVVGIDVLFEGEKKGDPFGDAVLAEMLSETKNLVMVSKVTDYEGQTDSYLRLEQSHSLFNKHAVTGHANLTTEAESQDQYKSSRTFMTMPMVGGTTEPAFAIKMASLYDPEAAQAFLDRDNETEVINFRGNALGSEGGFGNKFFALDAPDVFQENFTPDLIKDRVVLMGFMGEGFNDVTTVEDKFYTPLNPQYAGRAFPDMFGVVVHANILAMILNRDFVNTMPAYISIMVNILLCFFNVVLFSWIYFRFPLWYDGVTKTLQLLETFLLLLLVILFFHWFNYTLNFTLGIASVLLASDALEVYYGVIKNAFAGRAGRLFFLERKRRNIKNQNDETT